MSPHLRASALVMVVAMALSGCDSIFGLEGGLEYVAEGLEVVERQEDWSPVPIAYLVAEIGIVNTGRDTATVEFDVCNFRLEAFAEGETSAPAWRSRARTSWPRSTNLNACTGNPPGLRVGPGDTLRAERLPFLRPEQRLAEILADSLPTGPYAFRAMLGAGPSPTLLDLGTASLPTSRYPLPYGGIYRDGFHYEVEIDDGGAEGNGETVVKLHVGLSANRTQPLERDLVAACPVRLLAFQEADDVTTIPLPEPAWSWPESCPPGAEPVTLGPEDLRTFERPIDFEQVTGVAEPGRYHLMGVIEVDGRRLRLAVGEVTVPR